MNIKKLAIGIVTLGIALFCNPAASFADSLSVNFESPTYTPGSISGQDGWSNAVNPSYDQAVVTNTYGYSSFGGQAFRLSDAVTSGSFGDWVFAKPLTNGVGESSATAGSFSVGTRQTHFETQFDIASTVPNAQQPGLHVSVSPDRGDGSRMSYLRFEDGTSGIDVFFDDVQGTTNPANFVETQVASGLNRTVPHTVKLTLDTIDGPSNDVVKVYIDGTLVHTGTSWENYYRYDSEASTEQSPRIVKTVIFQARGTATPADAGKGFLFDNFSQLSTILVGPPTNTGQCQNGGWMTFNNPSFSSESACTTYVQQHEASVSGNLDYTQGRTIQFSAQETDTAAHTATGWLHYVDNNNTVLVNQVSYLHTVGNTAYFTGKVSLSNNFSLVGKWLFIEAQKGSPIKVWSTFTNQTTAVNGVVNATSPVDGPFNASGSLTIN
jgi:hypothetical protein